MEKEIAVQGEEKKTAPEWISEQALEMTEAYGARLQSISDELARCSEEGKLDAPVKERVENDIASLRRA